MLNLGNIGEANTVCFFFLNVHSSVRTELIKKVLSLDGKIKSIANELYQQRSLLVMGRGFHYATCLEGALVSWDWQSSQQTLGALRTALIIRTK